MNRLQNLQLHLTSNNISGKSPDDVVICCAVRTPLTKAKRGGLKDTAPQYLLSVVLRQVVQRVKLDPKLVQDIAVGNTLQPGAGQMTNRMAQFLAGFPDTTSIMTVNRLCSSGLQSCATIAAKIKSGFIDIGIGAGVQSMSCYDMNSSVSVQKLSQAIFENQHARNCLMSMGQTSQNVAEKYGITRQQQDKMAVQSHQKAFQARRKGLFKDQIVPVKTKVLNKDGKQQEITVTEDDGIRQETTLQGLAKLKPAFRKTGSTTAGNSSQVTDGAAAVLLVRRSVAIKLGLPILARFTDYNVSGVPPEIMGIGPAAAIPALLKRTNKTVNDIDIFEINQAFASQATYCVESLKIDKSKLNPKGGAIALGHPLGCTGSRQIATLLPQLLRTNKKTGVISMCIGQGMGAAALIERE